MISIKPEDLNTMSPQAMIAYKFMVKADREDPINIAMAEVVKEQARTEKIDNDRKANPDDKSERLAAAFANLAKGIYGVSYPELDEEAQKHVNELAQLCI